MTLQLDSKCQFFIKFKNRNVYLKDNDSIEIEWPTGEQNSSKIFITDGKFYFYLYHCGVILTLPLNELHKNNIKVYPIL